MFKIFPANPTHISRGSKFESFDKACKALVEIEGWDDYVTSEWFTVLDDPEENEGMAMCLYETQDQCDADLDGAYASRIEEY